MFVRVKKSGNYQYLQIVHNQRSGDQVRQRVLGTLGRLEVQPLRRIRIGPPLVFERLWQELGLPQVLRRLLADRKFEFDVERAVFLTVLHRLFAPGSDRAAERWKRGYAMAGVEGLQLHHLYRAMAWLGEPLPEDQQADATPFAPRCVKDGIEEALFQKTRDLFSGLELVFFDTTSIYFEGEGGETIGRYGNSKDHRRDRKQMVVAVVLDDQGRPICCELWPGNTTDAKTLIPIIDRLRRRFHIGSICVVADRGMISRQTIRELGQPERNVRYILGARLRAVKEVSEVVLRRGGRYREVFGPKHKSKDPAPLKVKEVWVEDRRYIVCLNEEQAEVDRANREAIVAALQDQLKQGATSLVGNKGYRKYLSTRPGGGFLIDREKVERDARFDGKWVLQTDTDWSAVQCALKYKELWMVEQLFRSLKSILKTRPIYHQCDETIRGHAFCSFLALVLLKELYARLEHRGWQVEWNPLRDDLDALEEITLQTDGKTFVLRTETEGHAAQAIQAAGVALPPRIRLAHDDQPAPPSTKQPRSAKAQTRRRKP